MSFWNSPECTKHDITIESYGLQTISVANSIPFHMVDFLENILHTILGRLYTQMVIFQLMHLTCLDYHMAQMQCILESLTVSRNNTGFLRRDVAAPATMVHPVEILSILGIQLLPRSLPNSMPSTRPSRTLGSSTFRCLIWARIHSDISNQFRTLSTKCKI